MANDASNPEGQLPSFDQTTIEGTAKAILWTMESVLSWDAPHPHAGRHVLRSQKELAKLWTMHGGKTTDEPQVEFSRHIVICVFVDEGAYEEGPALERIQEEEGELTVYVGRFRRPWKMINPAVVLKIRRFDGPCHFVDSNEAG
jgi:hypothetical protein